MEFSFEKLDVWQKSIELTGKIYEVTKGFPGQEQFGLVAQLRRAVVSVAANIAEGKGRFHKKEFVKFLYISRGSLYEIITLVKVSNKLGFISSDIYQELIEACESILSKLSGLINSLNKSLPGALSP